MTDFDSDYTFGKDQEQIVLPILCDFFGDNIRPTTDQYSRFDFVGKKGLYELKSRKISVDDFTDTLISANKAIVSKKPIYFIFAYTDGIYYTQYNAETFEKYRRTFVRNKRVDHNDKAQDYFFIPTEILLPIRGNRREHFNNTKCLI